MTLASIKEKITKFEGKIISISIFITSISLIGKLLGFFKVHLIARLFGTSKESDIFYAAFALPDLIFALLVVGTMNAALVPIFIKIIKKNDKKVLHTTLNTVISLLFGILLVLLGVLYFAMPAITSWVFSSKEVLKAFDLSLALPQGSNDYYQHLFINLSRLMLVSPLLLAVSSVFGAYLQAHKRFISTTLAALMYNIGIVAGIAFFVKFAPQYGVYSLSYSVLFGTLLHFLTQLIGVINLHDSDFSWSFDINSYVKDIAKLSLPRIFGLGVEQIAIMFNTFWGFTLGTGALSVFKFASTLYLVPVDLLSGSFLQVIFPRLNERAHENDNNHSLNKLYWRTLVLLTFIAVPVALLFIVLRLPIVRLVLGAGRFTWTATVVTSFTLAFFTPSILFQSLAALNIRTFYAINNTKTPLIVSFIGVISNILLSVGFTNFFSHSTQIMKLSIFNILSFTKINEVFSWFFTRGDSFGAVAGLAFGITVGLFLEVAVSFWLLSKKIGLWQHAKIAKQPLNALANIAFSSVITFIATYTVYRGMDVFLNTTKVWGVLVVAFVSGLTCLIVYGLTTRTVWNQYVDTKQVKLKILKLLKIGL